MKLYLAVFTLSKTRYMGDTTYKDGIRLVWAESEQEAEQKLHAAYDRGGPGDDSVYIHQCELSEAL